MSKTAAKTRPLSALVDELYNMQKDRYDLQNKAKAMKKAEDALEATIISALESSENTTGIAGKFASAQLVTKEKLVAEDWDAVWKYIVKNKAYDLVQRRLSDEAVKARLNEGEVVPGVQKMRITDLSLSKL